MSIAAEWSEDLALSYSPSSKSLGHPARGRDTLTTASSICGSSRSDSMVPSCVASADASACKVEPAPPKAETDCANPEAARAFMRAIASASRPRLSAAEREGSGGGGGCGNACAAAHFSQLFHALLVAAGDGTGAAESAPPGLGEVSSAALRVSSRCRLSESDRSDWEPACITAAIAAARCLQVFWTSTGFTGPRPDVPGANAFGNC